jgi:naphtho-gamma-pyrone polyketide synthase
MTIILTLIILRSYFGDCDEIYPSHPNNYVSGLCIGTLAAAAVGSSKSLGELVQAGVDAVRVSLKVGLLAARTAALFGPQRPNGPPYWSYVVAESQYPLALAEKAIAAYRDSSVSDIVASLYKPIFTKYADDSAPVVAVRQRKRPKLLDS